MGLPLGYSVRPAIVRKVSRTFLECEYTDTVGAKIIRCPIPHPFPGQGGGVLVGFEKDTRVLTAMGKMQTPFIVGILPDRKFNFSQDGVENITNDKTAYPVLKAGEVCLKGPSGSRVDLLDKGNIAFNAGVGDRQSDWELSTMAQGLFTRVNNTYKFTEAGRSVEGAIRRDLGEEEDPSDGGTFDFLSGEAYETLLTKIGRSPQDDVQLRTTTLIAPRIRNPGLIEKRQIVYEYADSFNVRDLESEVTATRKASKDNLNEQMENLRVDPSHRPQRRTDILNLNLRNYNHLIEKVEGTVVDIYGNILDINRNKIPVPSVDDIKTDKAKDGLIDIYTHLRRSIKSHYEINSRKDVSGAEPSKTSFPNNGKDHSRFSVDIDGEGLTKVNIPASSEIGNIPVLSRYLVSREEDDDKRNEGQFRDKDKTDVRISQFGASKSTGSGFAGHTISNSSYTPETIGSDTVTAGTAFHDMFAIAESVFSSGKLKDASPDRMNSSINNAIGDSQANAGGRSLHANLDGSVELSVGADTVDRKSLMIDLAGGIISHYGRDRNGRSIINQCDGDVIIQVGGEAPEDARFGDSSSKAGRIEIHLSKPTGDSQKIVIDDQGITIAINGNGVFSTTGDLTISAGGQLLLNGSIIGFQGAHDSDISGTRAVTGFSRLVLPDGMPIGY